MDGDIPSPADEQIMEAIAAFIQREVGVGSSWMIREQAWELMAYLRSSGVSLTLNLAP